MGCILSEVDLNNAAAGSDWERTAPLAWAIVALRASVLGQQNRWLAPNDQIRDRRTSLCILASWGRI